MKWFTEPNGKFVMKIPTDWQYMNVAAGYEEKSPFCFQPYENVNSSFQVSCYPVEEMKPNPRVPVQKAGTPNLVFVEDSLTDDKFKTKLWFANVEDHVFMAKYIYSIADEGADWFVKELEIVQIALSSLQLLAEKDRKKAISLDRYEKFLAALGASFDIRDKALENDAVIEFMVITANQIDAYLRMALVLKKQLVEKTDEIDLSLLFQGENDPPVIERKIYKQALSLQIIDEKLFDDLERLYKERNKVIHRYIITDLKTRDIYQIAGDYYEISERVRLVLKEVEEEQAKEKIGIYKKGLSDNDALPDDDRLLFFAQVNDKHLTKSLARKIRNDQVDS